MTELARDSTSPPGSQATPTTTAVVPDLIGLALADALGTAAWAGISLNVTHVVRTRQPWGVIVAQSPSPGSHLKQLWRIHALVSEAPRAGQDEVG